MGKYTPNMKPKKAGTVILISKKMEFKAQRILIKRNNQVQKYNYEYL